MYMDPYDYDGFWHPGRRDWTPQAQAMRERDELVLRQRRLAEHEQQQRQRQALLQQRRRLAEEHAREQELRRVAAATKLREQRARQRKEEEQRAVSAISLQAWARGRAARRQLSGQRAQALGALTLLRARLQDLLEIAGPAAWPAVGTAPTAQLEKKSLVFTESVLQLLLEVDGIPHSCMVRTSRRALVREMNQAIDTAEAAAARLRAGSASAMEQSKPAELEMPPAASSQDAPVDEMGEPPAGEPAASNSTVELEDAPTAACSPRPSSPDLLQRGMEDMHVEDASIAAGVDSGSTSAERRLQLLQGLLEQERLANQALKRQLKQKEALLKIARRRAGLNLSTRGRKRSGSF